MNRTTQTLNESYYCCFPSDELEVQQQIEAILESLSKEDRFLLTAREVDGFSYEDLASVTGESEGSLRTRLSRLKSNIRKQIGNEQKGIGNETTR